MNNEQLREKIKAQLAEENPLFFDSYDTAQRFNVPQAVINTVALELGYKINYITGIDAPIQHAVLWRE